MSSVSQPLPQAADAESLEPHWISHAAFPFVSMANFAVMGGIWWTVAHGHWWLACLLVPISAHLMHGQLIGFHEASHGHLRRSRFINDLDGFVLGLFSFNSFSLYRSLHQTHHMHLATARDEEFWPFVTPGTPRLGRILAALGELFFGIIYTPSLFFRTLVRTGSPIRSPRVRRRIWLELGAMAVFWTSVFAAVQHWHVWTYFLPMFLVPAWLAGNLQSWRKYIEHVGMMGTTHNGLTRNIVADTLPGKIVAFTLLHEPYHGVHHQHAGVRHASLVHHLGSLEATQPGELPPFPSYRHALVHLLRSLTNPRVGAQWLTPQASTSSSPLA